MDYSSSRYRKRVPPPPAIPSPRQQRRPLHQQRQQLRPNYPHHDGSGGRQGNLFYHAPSSWTLSGWGLRLTVVVVQIIGVVQVILTIVYMNGPSSPFQHHNEEMNTVSFPLMSSLPEQQLLVPIANTKRRISTTTATTEMTEERLGNYFGRKHLQTDNNTISSSFSTNNNNNSDEQPTVLIVGGTDGSGTRSFVEMLSLLGVDMVHEDDSQFDVHASFLQRGRGWPAVVQKVFKELKTVNYEVTQLSKETRTRLLIDLKRLKVDLTRQPRRRAYQRAVPVKANVTTTIAFGFKAPVTLALLPLLKEVFGKVKFLHVIRDGRDIAVSSNQVSTRSCSVRQMKLCVSYSRESLV